MQSNAMEEAEGGSIRISNPSFRTTSVVQYN